MNKLIPCMIILLSCFSACSSKDFGRRETGALIGTAVGAGVGAIVGNRSGRAGEGVAIGAGLGALGGGLIGNSYDNRYAEIDQRESEMVARQERIQANQKLIDSLRRKGVDVYEDSRGVVVNLPNVLFNFNKASLTPGAIGKISDIANIVREYPDRRLSIEGHTDSVGTISYNQELSEARARNVADELVAYGVSRRRIGTAGFGESRPLTSNRTEEGRQRNRRVEVIIN